MPSRICSACGIKRTIKGSDVKYLHPDVGFLCSKECVVHSIESFKSTLSVDPYTTYTASTNNLDDQQLTKGYSRLLHKSFRSEYEAAVAEFLHSYGFDLLYEEFSFDVGGKWYTPDFYVKPPYDCFVEVKGLFSAGGRKKLSLFLKEYYEVNFILVPWTLRGDFVSANSE